jgi:hypothetical protein
MGRPSKEFQAFRELTDRLLAVPKATIAERHAAHREASAKNPKRRGPKPKAKPLAPPNHDADDD